MKNLIILIGLALTAACTSLTTSTGSKPITFLLARQIVPKQTSSAEMKQLIGAPDSIQVLDSDPREIWVYLKSTEPATRRMYAFVNKQSGLIESVTWNVFDREPESSLDFTKKELGNPELTRTEPKWDKGDSAPDEVYFKSEKQRLTIVLRKTLNEVDMIQWH